MKLKLKHQIKSGRNSTICFSISLSGKQSMRTKSQLKTRGYWIFLNAGGSCGDRTTTNPIINKALGYKLHIELAQFEWPKYHDRGGGYLIYPMYESLTPESEEQEHQWQKNRVQSYLGSFTHFLKCLYNDNLDECNFSIEQRWNLSPLPKGKTKHELMSKPRASYNFRQNAKGFELKGKVDVVFDGTAKYSFKETSRSLSIKKEGGITPNKENRYFFVDEYGSLLDPTSLGVFRSWANDRVANNLPTNYSIGD